MTDYAHLWNKVDQRIIEALGPDVWIVGGAVRDCIMGRTANDVDLATKWTPDLVGERATATGLSVIETGIEHGTVTVTDGTNRWEITTLRKDISCDGRNATVEFGCDIEDDLARRDFTVNAMAVDVNGELIDPFGGCHDCGFSLIRCVGEPVDRFNEDLLRVLRLHRLQATLGGVIERDTAIAMREIAPRFCQEIGGIVSVERVVQEFNRAFEAERCEGFLGGCWRISIIQTILPEFIGADGLMQSPTHHPEGDVWTHTKQVVDRCPTAHRWHALLHDIGKVEAAEPHLDYNKFPAHESVGAKMIPAIGERLKWPTKLTDSVALTTKYHMQAYQLMLAKDWSGTPKRRFQNRVLTAGGREGLDAVLAVLRADHPSLPDDFVAELGEVTEVVQPILMGRHLIDVIAPGPLMGRLLKAALDYQLEQGTTSLDVLREYALSGKVIADAVARERNP